MQQLSSTKESFKVAICKHHLLTLWSFEKWRLCLSQLLAAIKHQSLLCTYSVQIFIQILYHNCSAPLRLPRSGVTPVIQLKTHAKQHYKYEVQRLQCRLDYLRRKRMAEALLRDLTHDFCSEKNSATSAHC